MADLTDRVDQGHPKPRALIWNLGICASRIRRLPSETTSFASLESETPASFQRPHSQQDIRQFAKKQSSG